MTEEPYRWLEAIGNRRDYVQHQLRDGSPVLAANLEAGVLLVGVGTGHSKVFEIHDRHALAGLGHPADLERVRQALIDAAHLEAFTRSPDDVSLRRLVGFNLGPQLKTAFEQLFSPPYLLRLLLAEVGVEPGPDTLLKLNYDGTFSLATSHVAVVAADPVVESAAEAWLGPRLPRGTAPGDAIPVLLRAWECLTAAGSWPEAAPDGRPDLGTRQVEAALLRRTASAAARYQPLG